VPHDTSASRDLSINIVVPIGGGGATPYSVTRRTGPWCTPGSAEEAKRLLTPVLAALGELLARAQDADRAGTLCDGADRLAYLQYWISDLQEELRCLEHHPEPRDDGR